MEAIMDNIERTRFVLHTIVNVVVGGLFIGGLFGLTYFLLDLLGPLK